jgi:Putative Flp pilus-assembly TadE/G-like
MESGRCNRRRGQVLLMVTLALIPLFGMLGLVTDVGYMQFVKMSAQTAAEAAAQAAIISYHETVGASNAVCGTGGVVCSGDPSTCPSNITTPTNAIEHGCMYAQNHGFNSANKWVTYQAGVGSVPPTAPGVGTASYWVTFRVIQRVPQMFSAVLGNPSGIVAARSTTAVIGASDCIYALNRSHSVIGLSVGGTASLVSSCGVYVNSSNDCAISTNGNGSILSAPEYESVGGTCTQNPLTPTPTTGLAPASDPLAALPVPASAPYTCDHIGTFSSNNDTDVYPGVYCGGIHVGNATFNFHAGTYILVGGGLSTQSNNSHITSTGGVTFYNTFGATTNSSNYSYSPIQIGATSTVSLIAPTSGTYAGILFFEDRNSPAANDDYGGGSTAVYQGIIYAKNAQVTMYGNSSVSTAYTMLVADTIRMVGTSGFNNNYSSLLSGSPIQQTIMVE